MSSMGNVSWGCRELTPWVEASPKQRDRETERDEVRPTMPNTSQAAGVKRADGCIAGAGEPSVKQPVNHRSQAFGADLISGAGHSLGLHQTPIEDRCFRETSPRETVVPGGATS